MKKSIHNIKLSTDEVFTLLELIKDIDPFRVDKDLKSTRKKVSNVEIPEVVHDYDYPLPKPLGS